MEKKRVYLSIVDAARLMHFPGHTRVHRSEKCEIRKRLVPSMIMCNTEPPIHPLWMSGWHNDLPTLTIECDQEDFRKNQQCTEG
jgi:hypothetical protein